MYMYTVHEVFMAHKAIPTNAFHGVEYTCVHVYLHACVTCYVTPGVWSINGRGTYSTKNKISR